LLRKLRLVPAFAKYAYRVYCRIFLVSSSKITPALLQTQIVNDVFVGSIVIVKALHWNSKFVKWII